MSRSLWRMVMDKRHFATDISEDESTLVKGFLRSTNRPNDDALVVALREAFALEAGEVEREREEDATL